MRKMLCRPIFYCVIVLLVNSSVFAQKISYSLPDNDDPRSINFDIAGKINGNYLVYKSYGSRYRICVYDNDMKLVSKNEMNFVPDKIISADMIAYRSFFYFIYQYQKRNIVYCMAAKINGSGTIDGEPKQLDTTAISIFANNKIYTIIASEDKQKIDVLKINSKDENNNIITNSLFNADLALVEKTRIRIPMPEHNDFLNEFQLDNDGNIIFLRSSGTSQNDNINQLTVITKKFGDSIVSYHALDVSNVYLDQLKIKVDNQNGHYLLTSFYSKKRRGTIDGMYINLWNRTTDSSMSVKYLLFDDELRSQAKSRDQSNKMAFNDSYIENIILRKDGGGLLVTESVSLVSRGNPYNRWDYLYNPSFSSVGSYYNYNYNPYSYMTYPWSNSPYYNSYNVTRYFADNITVFSFDSSVNTQWTNVVQKSQFDDNTDNLLGFAILNTGGDLHFLYNQLLRRQNILTDQSISTDGQLHMQPTLHNLDNGYDFMPRLAKQVGAHEILIPCMYRNSVCFAKVDF